MNGSSELQSLGGGGQAAVAAGAAPQGMRAHSIDWHLIMVWRPGWQSADDWVTIANHVRDMEPRIAPFVVRGNLPHSYTRRKAAARPSLVFSPGPLETFRPDRGCVYQGNAIPKFEQLRRLAAARVPIPRTAVLTADLRLDPAAWGEFVIVKPSDMATSSYGIGVQLMRTSRVRFRAPAEFPPDHPGRFGPMFVQQFIDTGDRISHYRVLTLFGEPLFVQFGRAVVPRTSLSASDEAIESAVVASQVVEKEKQFTRDPDVIALARAAHAAMPEIPLKGCDILRDAATGALYVLEVNPGGNTWRFSASNSARSRMRNGRDFEQQRRSQFDALRTTARLLVERTKAEAK